MSREQLALLSVTAPRPAAGVAAPAALVVPVAPVPVPAPGPLVEGAQTNEIRALTATGKDGWRTPRVVLDALDAEFTFQLDAAATAGHEAFPKRAHFGPGSPLAEDALDPELDWSDALAHELRGWDETSRAVWLNPPYSKIAGRGRGVWAWHERAWEETRRGLTTVILCPPKPDVGWFHHWAVRADEIRVYRQRIAFIDPETDQPVRGNTQGSCLVIYRPHVPAAGWPGGPRWSWLDVPKATGDDQQDDGDDD